MSESAGTGPTLSTVVGAAGPWTTVELTGELDLATAPALLDEVAGLIAREAPPRIALEVSRVSFCDSSGINVFIRLWKRAAACGGELVLLRPPARLADLVSRAGLDEHLRVCEALPEVPGATPEPA
ncbi:STAS domain-containing protein [Actinomadura sp. GC306]|uniref:STAS domain-containing protein n=1 Tax=Actinomadura sp. GC306 TaxID=2530367 RepID=UPI00140535E3|nr:STAS domain-containing protein [Actinomadura sp. GC306]